MKIFAVGFTGTYTYATVYNCIIVYTAYWMSFIPHSSFKNEKSFENVLSILLSIISNVTSSDLSSKYNNWKSILSVFK